MNKIARSKPQIILLSITWIIILIAGGMARLGNTQTNLQELQNRVAELENKLADAKARQEKAYDVQMRLEEQEQKLASLADSDKYKMQIIEIRADIKNVRTRIEAITKEKNDLEENLRLAKNLETILQDAKGAGIQNSRIPVNQSSRIQEPNEKISTYQPIEEIYSSHKSISWKIGNLHIDGQLNHEDRKEVASLFFTGQHINKDEILDYAYQLYKKQGLCLNFILHSKGGNSVDLDILLERRESRYSGDPIGGTFRGSNDVKSIDRFKNDDFRITVK